MATLTRVQDDLTIARREVGFRDRRDSTPWEDIGTFGVAFSRQQLSAFIERYVSPLGILDREVGLPGA